jgi:hypothetical protein
VPESAAKHAERKARAREAARRRQAVGALRMAEQMCGYGAVQLANGLSPAEARLACLELAGELASTAEALRRLTRLPGPERRALARQLANFGWPTKAIAAQLGVSDRAVRYYKAGRVCPPSGTSTA